MIAFAIWASVPLAVVTAAVTILALLPKREIQKLKDIPARFRRPYPKPKLPYDMTTAAHRVRYTSTESDIRDWDLVHIRDVRMVIHHVSLITGMCVVVTVILLTGETAGAIATGALASHDGINLLQDLMKRD